MKEVWRNLDFAKGLYQVSNLGRVKSLPRCRIPKERLLKGNYSVDGYLRHEFSINGKRVHWMTHRLVMYAFYYRKDYPNLDVNHINFTKDDNRVSNLEWCTRSENIIHSIKHGRHCLANLKSRYTLTEKQVKEIKRLLSKGCLNQKEIGYKYGVSNHVIHKIKSGKNWGHVEV